MFPRVTLRIELASGKRLGPGKARLLELVKETGSISAAARGMKMSYRRAWLLIDEANGLFGMPVVESSAGGAGGGGATLTAFGEDVVATYRAIEEEAAAAVTRRLDKVQGLTHSPASARRSKRP